MVDDREAPWADTSAQPAAPPIIGRHHILGELRSDGLSITYLARSPEGRQVAVEALRPHTAADPANRQRFGRAILAMSRVRSAHTVGVLETAPHGDPPHVVLEHLEGRFLNEVVEQDGPLAPEPLARLAAGTATALADIHRAGVVHRDVKPKNVLYTADGPKLTGFYIARALDRDDADITTPGTFIGTPTYLSPEVLAGEPAGPASDVFGWALTVLFAATGWNPFEADTVEETLRRVSGPAPALPRVPGPVGPLIRRCLDRDPARRPGAAELLPALGVAPPPTLPLPGTEEFTAATRDDALRHADFSLPGYQVQEMLGEGGFATVYRARQISLDRDVAVKVLDRRLGERDLRRFRREVDAAVRLSGHPGVVAVHDRGTLDDGRPFLVMELCPGGSLADRLHRDGPLPPGTVRRFGVQIADAVAAAHELGVLHRDIKPANLLLSRFGLVALADFGIAVLADPGQDHSVTLSMTPAYAAPEMFKGADPSPASDVYSLGATLYALLAGRAPHSPDRQLRPEALIAHLIRQQGAPLPRVPGVSDALMDVLRRALDPDPATRYPTAVRLRDALTALDP
nr:serine/threonine-protein kinase [Actinomadura craniellae]